MPEVHTMNKACMDRHQHADGDWLLASRQSGSLVHECVPRYIGYEERSRAPVRRLEVPHPNITVIINLGAPLAVHAPAHGNPGMTYNSFVAGLFDTVAVTANTGDSSGIEMNMTPLGMWQLFGVPMHELMNRIVPFDALAGKDAPALEERLRNTLDWDDRFDILDLVLTARMSRSARPPCEVQWAWDQLTRTSNAPNVSSIADALCWSRRRLTASFREHVGMTPKALARVVRFDRAVRRVRSGQLTRWSSLAYECGYADQSHLTREFREFAGLSPTEFLSRNGTGLTGLISD